MDLTDKDLEIINKNFKSNKEKIFFIECIKSGVKSSEIETLAKNLKNYKLLMKNNKIFLNDIINQDTDLSYFKRFEKLNDDVEKTILGNKANKLLHSVISNKYKNLVNLDTHEIFLKLVQKDISRNDLEEKVTRKIDSFKDAEAFNATLEFVFLNDENIENIIKKSEIFNTEILLNKDNKLSLLIKDYVAMKKLGTQMWCVTRSCDTYNYYTTNGRYFIINYDFNKPKTDPTYLSASIMSPKGVLKELYDSNDRLFIDKELENNLNKISPKRTFESFKKEYEEKNKKIESLKELAVMEDYIEEWEIFYPNEKLDKSSIKNILKYKLIEEVQFSYYDRIELLPKEEQIDLIEKAMIDCSSMDDNDLSPVLIGKYFIDPKFSPLMKEIYKKNIKFDDDDTPEKYAYVLGSMKLIGLESEEDFNKVVETIKNMDKNQYLYKKVHKTIINEIVSMPSSKDSEKLLEICLESFNQLTLESLKEEPVAYAMLGVMKLDDVKNIMPKLIEEDKIDELKYLSDEILNYFDMNKTNVPQYFKKMENNMFVLNLIDKKLNLRDKSFLNKINPLYGLRTLNKLILCEDKNIARFKEINKEMLSYRKYYEEEIKPDVADNFVKSIAKLLHINNDKKNKISMDDMVETSFSFYTENNLKSLSKALEKQADIEKNERFGSDTLSNSLLELKTSIDKRRNNLNNKLTKNQESNKI